MTSHPEHAHDAVVLTPVIMGVLALAVGPLLYILSRKRGELLCALDGFVLTSVGGLVIAHLLPGAMHVIGPLAILIAFAGLVLPHAAETWLKQPHHRAHGVVFALATLGMLLHVMMDGVGLAVGAHEGHDAMVWAVLLHRLPTGLLIWWLIAPRYGAKWAISALAGAGVLTVVGAVVGEALVGLEHSPIVAVVQALVGGSLLHVIIHRHVPADAPIVAPARARKAEVFGAVLGVAMVLIIPSHAHESTSVLDGYGDRLLSLMLESAPALLFGYVLAGIVAELLPSAGTSWMGEGNALSQSARGVAFGLPMPICSCGVVPLYQSLITRGVPAPAAMAFLIATPELGIESLLLSVPLLGGRLTAVRLVAAFVLAIGVGFLVGSRVPSIAPTQKEEQEDKRNFGQRLRDAVRTGLADIVDDTAVWIVFGLVVAALLEPTWLTPLTSLPDGLQVLVFTVVGIPMYVCASGATPLAAALIFAGVSPGAAISFLLSGPATNVTTFGVLRASHGQRIAVAFGLSVIAIAFLLGVGTNAIADQLQAGSAVRGMHSHGMMGYLPYFSLGLLGVAFGWSIWRRGPRVFFEDIITPGAHTHGPECDHVHHHHGPGCGHDHHHHDHHHHGHDGGHDHHHRPGCGHDHGHSHDHGHAHDHDHSHAHDHDHSHAHDHDHSHDHGHSHDHERGHAHEQGHGHSHEDGHGHGEGATDEDTEGVS